MGAPFAGRGFMTEGIGLVMSFAFGDLGLHRLEANIQPGNVASIALVRRCGFRKEGYSPRYLNVNGEGWKDHERSRPARRRRSLRCAAPLVPPVCGCSPQAVVLQKPFLCGSRRDFPPFWGGTPKTTVKRKSLLRAYFSAQLSATTASATSGSS
jgi:hypothetical protein